MLPYNIRHYYDFTVIIIIIRIPPFEYIALIFPMHISKVNSSPGNNLCIECDIRHRKNHLKMWNMKDEFSDEQ